MSVKGQLHSCRDSLMAGMRAAERTSNDQGVKILRACLDLVEHLIAASGNVAVAEVETTLKVLVRAASEVDDKTPATTTLVSTIRNAIERLQTVRAEIAAK